jgi:AraC-like DNA-binding protein/quercetin dioxygenase-like cupin family protein
MDPQLLKVNRPDTISFSVNKFNYINKFPGIWHYHPEYELTLILNSRGTRFVGDNIDRYKEGDLVFIGKNLAHTWKTDSPSDKLSLGTAEALVIHFQEDFLGKYFFSIPELSSIKSLLNTSQQGIKITGQTQSNISQQMKSFYKLDGTHRILNLLSILNTMAESSNLSILSSEGYCNYIHDGDSVRLNKVHEYIVNNFRKFIRLSDVAEVANMCPTAFSRYFTQRMRKPFSQFVNEIKIGYACKLLMGNRFSISQICYECGFQNVSNFNKQFKNITGITPKQYQLKYMTFVNLASNIGKAEVY